MGGRRCVTLAAMEERLRRLQADCRACTVCADQGLIARARPVVHGRSDAVFLLVGQAPGTVEQDGGRPFAGRAGRELGRWMVRAGFADDDDFRRWTYIAALMRCFPGRNASGTGDRPPPARGIANCRHWLEAELQLLRPRAVIPVGQMAIRRFLGPAALEERIGGAFGEAPIVLPLPHPSGQSRWLNQPPNRRRLEAALAALAELRRRFVPGAAS
ncbi:MAG: uracil-DNA glycosylase family protein [Candidatus Dormibacteraeota bacterium]|nr:uracil-DNA glycosylase family protein [Candidatus Dormibacteraeota bacterium]